MKNIIHKSNMKKGLLTVGLFLSIFTVRAQDFHFSQFFNTPLAQNPALTGKFREDYRLGGVYRNQWKQINATFASTGLFADVNFRMGADKSDKIGVGFLFVNDELGEDNYRNQYYQLSTAYHKTLDRLKRQRLSAGLQLGYVSKNLNTNNLTFGDQYNNWQLTNNPTGENFNGNSFGYLNFNAGIFWDFIINNRFDCYAGVSLFNINRPKETLFSDDNQLGIRSNYNIGANYMLTKNISLLPAIQLTRQLKAMDINLGGAIGYSIVSGALDKSTLMLGTWVRAKDAAIIYGGLKYRNYQLGVSYDITTSSLNSIKSVPEIGRSKNIGAIEITLIYVGFLKRAIPNDLTVPCRFF
jgi:type IX secretion system PorP/SprF family membrane protein